MDFFLVSKEILFTNWYFRVSYDVTYLKEILFIYVSNISRCQLVENTTTKRKNEDK